MFTIRRALIPMAAVALVLAASAAQAQPATYTAKLTGAAEVPDPRNTKAEGTLELKVSADGQKIEYKLTLQNISNPSEADIHLGGVNARGPLVVLLFPKKGESPKKGPFSGVLVEGSITAADLVGPMQGSSLADLIDELREGEAYTNVHTDDGVPPADSGPGDYHLGEIRGQIEAK